MRILFLSSMCLFRESRFGGAKRLYYYARELQRHAELHLVVLDGCREIGEAEFAPPEFPRHLYVRAHFGKSLRRALGVPIDFTRDVRRQEPAIQAFLGGQRFDAIFVAYALALSFLGRGLEDATPRVVYLEDDLM